MTKIIYFLILIFFIFWTSITKAEDSCNEYKIISSDYSYPSDALYSPDWKSFYFMALDDSDNTVIIKDSKKIATYYNNNRPVYSHDWKSFAYVKGQQWEKFVIKDWIQSTNSYYRIYKMQYSNNNILTFIAEIDWKVLVNIDWVESKRYDSIYWKYVRYSVENKTFAFIAEEKWKIFSVINWIEWRKYDSYNTFRDNETNIFNYNVIQSTTYSNLEFKFQMNAFDYRNKNDKLESFIERKLIREQEFTKNISNLIYHADSWNYAFVVREDSQYFVIYNWIKSKKYDDIKNLQFSQKNNNFSFIVKENWNHYFSVINWIEWKKYKGLINKVIWSPKWNSYAFFVSDTNINKKFVVVDWIESEKFDIDSELKNLRYSPNWENITFERKWQTSQKYDSFREQESNKSTFSETQKIYKKNICNWNKINSNTKLDRTLNKFFLKIDIKSKKESTIIYNKIISKIEVLIEKTNDNKKIELLSYIKEKIESKIN